MGTCQLLPRKKFIGSVILDLYCADKNRGIVCELLWFIRGQTNSNVLSEQGLFFIFYFYKYLKV
jgi:hypothetical protein